MFGHDGTIDIAYQSNDKVHTQGAFFDQALSVGYTAELSENVSANCKTVVAEDHDNKNLFGVGCAIHTTF